jgi:hypothetical protein
MNFIERFKNSIEYIKSLNRKQLESWKYFTFFIIVADIFGLYWFLNLKKLGIALLFIVMGFLTLILILEGKIPPKTKKIEEHSKKNEKGGKNKMSKNKEEEDEEEDDEEEDKEETEEVEELKDNEGMFGNFNIGLPDADEYNKRMEKALGQGF